MKMKCRIIGNSFFCSDESAEMQEKIQKSIEKLDQQTKDYSIDRLFGLIVGDVDERFVLELIKLRGARLEKQNVEMMAMLKRTTLAIKYITDGIIQSNSMLNVLLIESAELIKKMEVER